MAQPPNNSQDLPRVQDEGWLVGKLLAHGLARHPRHGGNSYYFRIRTLETEEGARRRQLEADESARPLDGRNTQRGDTPEDGGVVTRWGTDLDRAINRSKSGVKVGQVVGARIKGREPVYKDSRVIPDAYLNLWEVETVQYLHRRNINARKMNEDFREARRQGGSDPVLRALYLIHTGAERLAPLWFPNPDDQKRFVQELHRILDRPSREREAVIASVARRLAEQQKAQSQTPKPNGRQPETPAPPRERAALVRE
jgi:hypothetical protein